MLTILDLSRVPLRAPGISEEMLDSISWVLSENGRILVYLNRRGAQRAFICRDCGTMTMCPRCDLALALHTTPKRRLLCHHCSYEASVPSSCPKCSSARLEGVGLGSQGVEDFLVKSFPSARIVRLDSDAKKHHALLDEEASHANIVIATNLLYRSDAGEFDLVVFPLVESDLVTPEFNTEERAYIQIRLAMEHAKEAIIQTNCPGTPLLSDLYEGNYRKFLQRTLEERKAYGYPPYASLAYLHIQDKNSDRALDMIAKLRNKLQIIADETGFDGSIFSDREIFTKRADQFIGKIVIKGKNIDGLLEGIRGEIMRNRNVQLERKE